MSKNYNGNGDYSYNENREGCRELKEGIKDIKEAIRDLEEGLKELEEAFEELCEKKHHKDECCNTFE